MYITFNMFQSLDYHYRTGYKEEFVKWWYKEATSTTCQYLLNKKYIKVYLPEGCIGLRHGHRLECHFLRNAWE